jgi:hypothetical protein
MIKARPKYLMDLYDNIYIDNIQLEAQVSLYRSPDINKSS